MDLQRGEAVLSRLEKETENVAAVGALGKQIETVRSELNDALSNVGSLAEQLSQTNSTLVESAEAIQHRLASLQDELARLSREIDERVRTQIDRATTHYETVLRAELRSVVDRIELNLRDEKQAIDEATKKVLSSTKHQLTAQGATQRRQFLWTLVMLVVIAVAAVASINYLGIR